MDDFERRALSLLEPGASTDRGAERLVTQTRFLATAFREFERQIAEHGSDEHDRRERDRHDAGVRARTGTSC